MTSKLALLSLFFSLTAAFSPAAVPNPASTRNGVPLCMAANGEGQQDRSTFLRQFSLICGGIAASAVSQPANAVYDGSSIVVADAIKTLDMTLPTYGDISSSKAGDQNSKSLYVDPAKDKGLGIPASQSKRSSSKENEKKKKKSSKPMIGY